VFTAGKKQRKKDKRTTESYELVRVKALLLYNLAVSQLTSLCIVLGLPRLLSLNAAQSGSQTFSTCCAIFAATSRARIGAGWFST
jgi:hypothetical protein